jgi:threonine dehydrogenase-like Zn-dependent dehydrogenase
MGGKMKAVVFEGEGNVRCVEKPIPAIKENEVLLRVLAASVCGSDLGITAIPQKHFATPGVILGHECVAEIADAPAGNSEFKRGDRVLVNPMIPCGDCAPCKAGQVNMCKKVGSVGEDRDGVFAEYYAARISSLHHISADVDVDIAVFAEPLACVMNGFKRLDFLPGKNAFILGAGPIGLLFTKLLKASGSSRVIVSEAASARIKFAREKSGADYVIDALQEDIEKVMGSNFGENGADIVIDTVGMLFETALKYVTCDGKILLFGINDRMRQDIRQFDITRKELTVIGSYATHLTFPPVIKMLENNVLDLKPLITNKVKLEELPEGIECLRRGEAMKVVVYP